MEFDEGMSRQLKRLRQEEARLELLLQKAKKQSRKDATRRKIIYGAAFLRMVDAQDEWDRPRILRHVGKYITRERDREFLASQP